MSHRRRVILASLAILGCGGGVGIVVIDRARLVRLEPGSQTVAVAIGHRHVAEFTISNHHPWRSAKIDFVKARCGCFRVREFPREVAPGQSATIKLEMFILPTGARVDNTLRVYLVGGDRLEAEISADPIVPFGGWPERADGVFDAQSGTIFFEIEPVYRERIVLAQGFTPEGVPVETLLDTAGGTIVMLDPGVGGTLTVTFVTEDGESAWTGEIVDQRNLYVAPSP